MTRNEDPAFELQDFEETVQVATSEELPGCDADNAWTLYFVQESEEFFLCTEESYVQLITRDEDTLAQLGCSVDEIARYDGASWTCSEDKNSDSDTLAGLSCEVGEIPTFGEEGWECTADQDTDTDTDTLASLSCSTDQIAEYDGGQWVCADPTDEDALGGLACGAGEIAAQTGGGWACATPSIVGEWAYEPWATNTPRTSLYGGLSGMLALDGAPIFTMRGFSSGDYPGFIHFCEDATCTSHTRVQFAGDTDGISLGLTEAGLPLVAYGVSGVQNLLVCADAQCSSSSVYAIGTAGNSIESFSSIILRENGLPLVFYQDASSDLQVYACDDVSCATGTTTLLHSNSSDGMEAALGVDGRPVIAFHDPSNTSLKLLKCAEEDCSTGGTTTQLDNSGNVGERPHIAIREDGTPIISYWLRGSGYIKVYSCDDTACTTGVATNITSIWGSYANDIVIGADGQPLVWFSTGEETEAAQVLIQCTSRDCSSFDELHREGSNDYVEYAGLFTGPDNRVTGIFNSDLGTGTDAGLITATSSVTYSLVLSFD